jgi:hypothetical protein
MEKRSSLVEVSSLVQIRAPDSDVGQTAPSCSPPLFTPEIVAQLARESSELGTAFHLRILSMWNLPWRERKIPCCPPGCCPGFHK